MDTRSTIAIILVICLILVVAAFYLGIEMAHGLSLHVPAKKSV